MPEAARPRADYINEGPAGSNGESHAFTEEFDPA